MHMSEVQMMIAAAVVVVVLSVVLSRMEER